MSTEELELLRKKLIARDNAALASIYRQYKEPCVNVLVKKGYCKPSAAEDTFTDAILILRQNIISSKIVELSNPVSYLISICRNLINNTIRSDQRKFKKTEEIRLLIYNNGYDVVEDTLDKEKLIEHCKKALLTLSERCQQLITAYYVHGLSMRIIAEELGLKSSDVAKTLKSRCYKTWQKAVQNLDKL